MSKKVMHVYSTNAKVGFNELVQLQGDVWISVNLWCKQNHLELENMGLNKDRNSNVKVKFEAKSKEEEMIKFSVQFSDVTILHPTSS